MVKTKPAWMSRTERLLERTFKHGPYLLPIGLLLSTISFYLDGPENLWFWYLSPFAFYSLAYIFGRNSTNEGVITTQILLSLFYMPYIFCLNLVAILTKTSLSIMYLTSIFVMGLTYLYILALYFVLAKQALKDASIWKRNLYLAVFGLVGDSLLLPIAALLLSGIPVDGKDIYEKRNFLYTYLAVCSVIKALVNCGFFIIILCCYSTRKSFDAKARKPVFFIDVNDNGCGQKKNGTVADVHQWWNKCNLFEAKHSRIQPEKLILPL